MPPELHRQYWNLNYFVLQRIVSTTAWKVSKYEVFFWSVFSCIHFKYRKTQTRKNSVFEHFLRSEHWFWQTSLKTFLSLQWYFLVLYVNNAQKMKFLVFCGFDHVYLRSFNGKLHFLWSGRSTRAVFRTLLNIYQRMFSENSYQLLVVLFFPKSTIIGFWNALKYVSV